MRSIEARFKMMVDHYPFHSSFICFLRAVDKQDFSRPMIIKWFRKLVDKEDYDKKDIWNLINQCEIKSRVEHQARKVKISPKSLKNLKSYGK